MTTPIFDALIDEHPEAYDAMIRRPWSYRRALRAADAAIAERANQPKRPAKKRAPRKAS